MGILSTDILLKTMLEASIADLRRSTWLLEDVFGGMATDPLSKIDYGFKEVDQAKKWFLNNNIPVYLHSRVDSPTFPCLTIVLSSSSEDQGRTSFSDYGREEEVHPKSAIQTPQKVYTEFTPVAYNPSTGIFKLPAHLNTNNMVEGQFIVSPRTGKSYAIKTIESDSEFKIDSGVYDDFVGAYIVPRTALWNVKREITYLNESFMIGCHAQSDPVQCIWLRQLTMYILLRYKEAYLEARGFELSTLSAQGVDLNPHFEVEKVYSALISLSGTVECNWVKYIAPKLQGIRGFVGPVSPNAVGFAGNDPQPEPYPTQVPTQTFPIEKTGEPFESGIHIADATATPDAYKEEIDNQSWDMAADVIDGDDDE